MFMPLACAKALVDIFLQHHNLTRDLTSPGKPNMLETSLIKQRHYLYNPLTH